MKLVEHNPMHLIPINSDFDRVWRYAYGDDECQVGSVALHYNQANKGYEWFVWSVEIYDTFRGLGHGRDLMKLLMAEAKRRGASKLCLYVKDGNVPAVALYLALGFKEVAAWGYPRQVVRMEVML